MVASQNANFVGIFYLKRKEKTDGLNALTSSVDIIAHEQVGRLWREPPILE